MITNDSYVPVPDDLNSIVAIHDGNRWINGIIPGSVYVSNGVVNFAARWNSHKRLFSLAVEIIGGYQCDG